VQPPVWFVRAGPAGCHVAAFEEYSLVAVGYPEVGSVAALDWVTMLARVAAALPPESPKVAHVAGMLHRFAREIEVGAGVVTSDSAKGDLLFGRVEGPYEYNLESPIDGYPHLRRVSWLSRWPRQAIPETLRPGLGAPQTVFKPGPQQQLAALPVWRPESRAAVTSPAPTS
jgi:restriction system protein